ncbi:transcription factor HHO5-like isoform X2 [Pyrus communis]|uniref:transcription factor HHO5-like isoform X2 n=1 Tax=Pyrus communis TaxID=23211 RepID=UPI0035C09C95
MELLSLDSSPLFVPKTITDFLAQLAAIKDGSQRSSELDGYVKRLEDELRKIEVFKRELPLCMLLLKDAIERLKEEGMRWRRMDERPVVEEFMPLKGNSEEDGGVVSGKENIDKKNWMSSAQLWNTSINVFDYTKHNSVELKLGNEADDRSVPENPIVVSNNRAVEGALLAFRGQNELSGFAKPCLKEDKEVSEVPNLCLMTPLMSEALAGSANANSKTSNGCKGGGLGSGVAGQVKLLNKPQPQPQQQQQSLRKPRRCWSPELHRRFVDALQQLGGTEATPKQIRELMQVEGLTNDEVKSHLQKYRLHIRKLPPSAAAGQGNALLMSLDHSGDHSKANNVQSGSPQGPLLAGGYAKGRSTTGGESGNSREAEEDEKSDG